MPDPSGLAEPDLRAIAERALPHWGLTPERLEIVSRSENVVFRLDGPDGAHALRIHRPGYHSLRELESELLWTRALNDAGVHAPVGRSTLDGAGYVTIPTPDGAHARAVGVVDWIPGDILNDQLARETDFSIVLRRFEQLGRLAAAIHNQSITWTPPRGFRRHAFDVPGYVGPTPFWGRFWDLPPLTSAQRRTLARARDGIEAILTDYGRDRGTFSLIHADLHTRNVLVEGDTLHLIDFDDAGFGWHQYELAVILFDYDNAPELSAVSAALLRGYRQVRPFAQADADLLPLFLLIRRLLICSWVWDRPELGYHEDLPALIDAACDRADAFPF